MRDLRHICGATIVLLLIAGCGGHSPVMDTGIAPSAVVVGSGHFVTEARPAHDFSTIVLTGGLRATVTLDGSESLQITAEDNLLPFIQAAVVNGRLTLTWQAPNGGISSHGADCRISARSLRSIEASAGSRISVDGIQAADFGILLSGAADFTGSGSVDRLDADLSGASQLHAGDLTSRAVNARLSGASVALLRVVDSLVVNASGASLLQYLGDPTVQAETSGASTVRRVGP